jgi:hypothetical protein
MWQRFTEEARRVVFYAQEEALRLGSPYVDTEHLLLGLCREPQSASGEILTRLKISHADLTAEIDGESNPIPPDPNMTLTPRSKRVIDTAYEEARELGNNYIGTEHLLLGLVKERNGVAGQALFKLGASLKDVRRVTREVQGLEPEIEPEPTQNATTSGRPQGSQLPDTANLLMRLLLLRQERLRLEVLTLLILTEDSRDTEFMFEKLPVGWNDTLSHMDEYLAIQFLEGDAVSTPYGLDHVTAMAKEEADVLQQTFAPIHFVPAIFREGKNELSIYFESRGVTLEAIRTALKGTAE